MEERKVKGTMLADHVRTIRKFKDKNWDQYLKPEDWDIINTRIMDPVWYPFDTYKRCAMAVFKVLANEDVTVVRERGRIIGKDLFTGPYKKAIVAGDPLASLKKFVNIYDLFFNFSSLSVEAVGEKNINIHHDFDPKDPAGLPYCHLLMGYLDTLVDMAGGNNAEIKIMEKQWEGSPTTRFSIFWE